MNNILVTKAKIKRADSGNLKGCATNKLYCRLTVKCSEIRHCTKRKTVNYLYNSTNHFLA